MTRVPVDGRAVAPPATAADPRRPTLARCPSIYVTPDPVGRRWVRKLDGTEGLLTLKGHTRSVGESAHFHARIVAGRYGTADVGVMRHTAHLHDNDGTHYGHNHPVSRLAIIVDGHGTVHVADRTLELVPGTGVLVSGSIPVSYEAGETVTRVQLDLPVDDRTFTSRLLDSPLAYWATPSPALQGLAAFAQAVLRADNSQVSWSERAEVRRALESLILTTLGSAPPLDDDADVRPSTRDITLDYIRAHYSDPGLTCSRVAASVGVSLRTLQRAFKDERGVAEWIALFRLEHALTLLRDERLAALTIPEIAERSGFGSTIGMRRAVSAATGYGPTAYRRLHLPDDALHKP